MSRERNPYQAVEKGQHYLEKELHQLLQDDTLMFEFFQDDVVDGLWYWDLTDPENEWMSPKFWQLFGYDPEFKKHKVAEWHDIIFEEDLQIAKRNLDLHLKNPDFPYDQVVRYRHRNGSIVWVRCKGVAIYNKDGEPVRLLGCHLDMTRFMEKQQAFLGLQIKHDHNLRRLDEIHHENAQLKTHYESMVRRLRDEAMYDDSGFSGKQHFVQQFRLLAETAQRLNLKITILRFFTDDLLGDKTKDNAVKRFVHDVLLPMIPGAVAYPFSSELIGIVAVGLGADAANTLEAGLAENVESYQWLCDKPVVGLKFRELDITDEMTNKYLDLSYILELFFV